MSLIYQKIANFLIIKKLKFLNKIFFNIFKFFVKKKIILDFIDFKFYVYPNKKDLSIWMLRYLKIWDETKIKLILDKIKKNEFIFIDVGCNYGAYSIPIAKKHKNLLVYSFDPSENALKKLKENILLNNIQNINFYKVGIGEKNKKVYFDDNLSNFKNSGSYQIIKDKVGKEISVDSIDNLIIKKIILPKKNIFIKLDIEGYEFFALQGMVETFKSYKVIIFFEFSKKIFENHYNFEIDFKKFIDQHYLKIFDKNMNRIQIDYLFKNIKTIPKEWDVLDDFIISN